MNDNARTRRRLERLAWLLDDSIPLPLIQRRIGLDSVIGLVPVVGDLLGGALSASIIVAAARMGVSWHTLVRMLANTAIEMAVGVVPFVGDLFDMGWKANQRNVRLMGEHLDAPDTLRRESSLRIGAAVLLVVTGIVLLLLAVVALAAGLWWAISSLRG